MLEFAPGSSTAIYIDGISVCVPIFCAISWSIVVPLNTSAPAVFFGFCADLNAAATQWPAPVTPGGGSADRECRPLKITDWFRNGSSGFQLKGNVASSAPSFSGTQ